jgi:hypothetical protein
MNLSLLHDQDDSGRSSMDERLCGPGNEVPYDSNEYQPSTRIRWGLLDAGIVLAFNVISIYGLVAAISDALTWKDPSVFSAR